MANTSSAKKAARQIEARTIVNKARKSRIRTFIRKVEDALVSKDSKKARESFKVLEPELMRGVTKGVFKLNTASRKLKRLASSIRKIEKPGTKTEATKPVAKKAPAKTSVKKASTKKVGTKKAQLKKPK